MSDTYDNNNIETNTNVSPVISGIDAGVLIDTPIKPGYIFSHWSLVKPGTTYTVIKENGESVELEKECPPFNFSKEVILENTTLYAVFIPKVTVTFKNDDETLAVQNVFRGGKAYDPTPKAVKSEVESGNVTNVGIEAHNSHVGPQPNKNTGIPKIVSYRN